MKRIFLRRKHRVWFGTRTPRTCIKVVIPGHPWTRRGLLSVLASVYDPLGVVGPSTLPSKLLLQRLPKKSFGWDSVIPDEGRLSWKKKLDAQPHLNGWSILRCYSRLKNAQEIELHFFADARGDDYGAVSYIQTKSGLVYACSFIIGNCRVAPSHRLITPRLELCAALTAVRLSKIVIREHDFHFNRVVFWSDPTTVLSYLKNTSKRRPAFETNRIELIRKMSTVDQWRWLDTAKNSVDYYSVLKRGVTQHLEMCTRQNDGFVLLPSYSMMKQSGQILIIKHELSCAPSQGSSCIRENISKRH